MVHKTFLLCAENQNCEPTSERVCANTFRSAVKNLAKNKCVYNVWDFRASGDWAD